MTTNLNLGEIEAIKTVNFSLTTYTASSTVIVTSNFLKNNTNINFVPDLVRLKKVTYYDGSALSIGMIQVNANFIPDNDILVTFTPEAILDNPTMASTKTSQDISPEIIFKYIETNQFQFSVQNLAHGATACGQYSYLYLTIEFVKLKKNLNNTLL